MYIASLRLDKNYSGEPAVVTPFGSMHEVSSALNLGNKSLKKSRIKCGRMLKAVSSKYYKREVKIKSRSYASHRRIV